ncbi:MAG TPA: universal stress protein [Thermoprotei archaeon]|nr:universal stress protein [Thermoprotei archaeon]
MKLLIPIGLYTKPLQYKFLGQLFNDPEKVNITLFTVVQLPVTTSLEQEDIIELPVIEEYKQKLEEISTMLKAIGFTVIEKLAFARDIVEAILNEVQENPYDMIILVKRRNLPRFIGRSVSRSLLPKIHKPILILTME